MTQTNLAAPLAERVEYASPAWLAAAKRFLEERAAALSATPFSVARTLRAPPPHLAGGRTSIGYTLRLSRDAVEVEAAADPNADLHETADYNCALPFCWTVRGDDAEAAGRAHREYRYLAGERAPEALRHREPPAGTATVLRELHDHLARRTVNNPDIDHRAAGFGLEGHIEALDDTGYAVLRNAFTTDFADELRAETHRNHDAAPPDSGFRATMLLRRGPLWEQAAIHPWVLTLAEYLLGRGCVLYQSDTIVKGPGLDTHPGLHADYGASRVAEPFPEYCLEATAVWAIDDFDLAAGPTVILPGSFRKRSQVPPGTGRDGTVTIEMPKGSIAFWHGASWHGSMPRQAPGRRTSLHNADVRFFMRPLERYDDIDQRIVDRNPPVFATLCGLDDPFGKSGDTGADFERMRYASEAGYGRTAL